MCAFGRIVTRQAVGQARAELDAVAEILAVQTIFASAVVAVAIAVVHERAAKVIVLRVKRAVRLAHRADGAVDQSKVLVFPGRMFALTIGEALAFVGRTDLAEVYARGFDTSFDGDTIGAAVFFGRTAHAFEAHVARTPRTFAGAWSRSWAVRVGIDSRVRNARWRLFALVVHATQGRCAIVGLGATVPRRTSTNAVCLVGTRRDKRSNEHQQRCCSKCNAGPSKATRRPTTHRVSTYFHDLEDATT